MNQKEHTIANCLKIRQHWRLGCNSYFIENVYKGSLTMCKNGDCNVMLIQEGKDQCIKYSNSYHQISIYCNTNLISLTVHLG